MTAPATSPPTDDHQTPSALRRGRVSVWGVLAGGFLAMIIAWWPGVTHLIGVWLSSPTYLHGLLVLPVSITLVAMGWRHDDQAELWWRALSMILPGAGLYFLGDVYGIFGFQHAGIIVTLLGLVCGTFGKAMCQRHRFAIGFLVFMLPVGEGLLPFLQILTAKGIMAVTAIFDMPAVQLGTLIRTDAGDFLVEEGCAGLRFLTASGVTGVLCAHLFYTTRWKQVTMVLASLIVPIIANVIRASAIVLVGTWSDLRIATGFDHILYGWGFFSVILGVIIFAALLLAEPDAPERPSPAPTATASGWTTLWWPAGVAVLILGVGALT